MYAIVKWDKANVMVKEDKAFDTVKGKDYRKRDTKKDKTSLSI